MRSSFHSSSLARCSLRSCSFFSSSLSSGTAGGVGVEEPSRSVVASASASCAATPFESGASAPLVDAPASCAGSPEEGCSAAEGGARRASAGIAGGGGCARATRQSPRDRAVRGEAGDSPRQCYPVRFRPPLLMRVAHLAPPHQPEHRHSSAASPPARPALVLVPAAASPPYLPPSLCPPTAPLAA